MNLEEQRAAEAAETEEKQVGTAEQFAEADAAADPNAEAPPAPSVEDIASELGWMPEDKFKGPKDKWKPADQFIRDGKNIQERLSRDLKALRETTDTIVKTNGQIMADRLAEQHAQLAQRYAKAVDEGDADAAWKAANAIRDVQAQAQGITAPQRQAPAPEAEQWAAKNSRVMRDPLAAQRALAICNEYAKAGYSTADQLASTEAIVRREFPHLFDDKPAPQVNGHINRNSASTGPKGQTAKDMPKEARQVADDMVERGLIPNADAYAKNYFAEIEKRKAQ